MLPAAIKFFFRAALEAVKRTFRWVVQRISPRLTARANVAATNLTIPIPAQQTWLQGLPVEILFEISKHLADDKTFYVFSKPYGGNWEMVIDPDRPGHNPPGGRAIYNPRRWGSQFLHNYRPEATLADAYPAFAPFIKLPPPAVTPQPLDVFFLVNGIKRRSVRQYQIQEQHIPGWGVVTEVNQGPYVEWPLGIPFAL